MFSCGPIPGNVNCLAKDFHGESYYDIPALAADPRFIDSMRLVQMYSLLSFMSSRQFFYPWVVLEFSHTMTSQGVSDPMQLRFSIDGCPGIMQALDITAALGRSVVLANSIDYQQWPQPLPSEMIRSLSRDTAGGYILFCWQLPPQMLLTDHVLWSNLFPLQRYLQCIGAILEALYRISEGYWFGPAELVMIALLHFMEKVHRKDLARAEAILLLMSRLLCQVLEHLGFPKEPRIERRLSCPQILSRERTLSMPLSFLLHQQEEVEDDYVDDLPRGEQPVSVPDSSAPVPSEFAPAPPKTVSPSSTLQEPPEHIPGTSRDFLAVLDAVTALIERMARAEVTLMQN